ncbi:hypothetical protein LTR05_004905 [Lithohypha guttulata]|uniref:NAD(P)-binding protein n=1 Tax=Lithohypha guttulata TaxID=1690604 RepID=A0AAN7T0A8_9EURO|nr:hypothetical protein LTR05_004905 [Lithohypha guttulata]
MENFSRDTTGLEVVETLKDQVAGKTFVITGPSKDSLAAEAAFSLASASSPPAQIILLGRTLSKIQPVIDRITEANASIKTTFVNLDLSNLNTVRNCAAEIAKLTSRVDVLINSAGIMALENFQTSADGFEMQLAACHIGHFLLTGLLLPLLKAAPAARVVTLTSMGYESSDFLFDDYNFSEGKTYNRWLAYGQAKTANVMFTTELARRASAQGLDLKAYVVHPGVILSSGIMKELDMESLMKALEETKAEYAKQGIEYVPETPKSIEQGCATMLVASLANELSSHNGAFLRDSQIFAEEEQKPWVKDAEKARKLWELSEGWVGEKFL